MSGPIGSSHWMYNNAGGSFYNYSIENSVRMSDASNTTLQWTAGTPSSSTTWTMSFWIKRWNQSTNQGVNEFFSAGTSGSAYSFFSFVNHYITHQTELPGARNKNWANQYWRDSSAWYHFVFRANLNEGTQANRLRMYVNGVEYTATLDGITQSTWAFINASGVSQNWGGKTGIANSNPGCDHYLADINFCDGQSYAPTEFAETVNGIWVPKDTSGLTFGNNGYRLEFKQTGTGGASASTIGADTSGNNNHFTDSGLAARDVVPDSPTNNFATLNPLYDAGAPTHAEGNLQVSDGSTAAGASTYQIPKTGKWYFESKLTAGGGVRVGVSAQDVNIMNVNNFLPTTGGTGNYFNNTNGSGTWIDNGTGVATGGGTSSFTANVLSNVLGVTVDVENLEIYFQADVGSGLEVIGPFTINSSHTDLNIGFNMNADTVKFNFGQDSSFSGSVTSGSAEAPDANGVGDFYYAPTTDALALCSANLPEATIGPNSTTTSDEHFNTVLYTGNGSTQSITGVGFQPDLVWIKSRSNAYYNTLYDVVRGTGTTPAIYSNGTEAEGTYASLHNLTSYNSDGFSLGTTASSPNTLNENAATFVAWNWKAGGTAVSNTDGSITSSVSANPDAGFAVGIYTGNATAGATIGHSLGATPEMVIVKRRTNARDWAVYHKDQSATPTNAYLLLNSTAAVGVGSTAWNNGTFTSSVFTIGSHELVNFSGDSYVFYAFRGIDGHSKCGKYVGNNSTDGPFNYTGFRPAFVIIKRTDSAAGWVLYDDKRDTYNQMQYVLWPNLNNAEYTSNLLHVDFLSNGFKVRNATYGETNASGGSYIYIAFAEQPFKYANAR